MVTRVSRGERLDISPCTIQGVGNFLSFTLRSFAGRRSTMRTAPDAVIPRSSRADATAEFSIGLLRLLHAVVQITVNACTVLKQSLPDFMFPNWQRPGD
jgi:hypothetical protein